jgi:hypothetical protein
MRNGERVGKREYLKNGRSAVSAVSSLLPAARICGCGLLPSCVVGEATPCARPRSRVPHLAFVRSVGRSIGSAGAHTGGVRTYVHAAAWHVFSSC